MYTAVSLRGSGTEESLCKGGATEMSLRGIGTEQSLCKGGATEMSLRGSGTDEAISGITGREIASLPPFG